MKRSVSTKNSLMPEDSKRGRCECILNQIFCSKSFSRLINAQPILRIYVIECNYYHLQNVDYFVHNAMSPYIWFRDISESQFKSSLVCITLYLTLSKRLLLTVRKQITAEYFLPSYVVLYFKVEHLCSVFCHLVVIVYRYTLLI